MSEFNVRYGSYMCITLLLCQRLSVSPRWQLTLMVLAYKCTYYVCSTGAVGVRAQLQVALVLKVVVVLAVVLVQQAVHLLL
jgi:hypothetical protein